jgi:hypothetical protein
MHGVRLDWRRAVSSPKVDDNARLVRGERLQDPEEGARTVGVPSDEGWPAPPDEAAYYGLAGRIVRALEPHTESDPVAILVQLLTAFGSAAGRGPHFQHESTQHYPRLNVVLVGKSSKARKGTSWEHVRSLMHAADEGWERRRVLSGLSSGEGLIQAVRNPRYEKRPIRQAGRITGYDDELVDEGEPDKRLLVIEAEFARVLQAASREGSTLSAIIREAWDSGKLSVMTKSPVAATDAHISIIGHITGDELLKCLSRTDSANGFANRFLWLCVRRSKLLPEGGNFTGLDVSAHVRDLKDALGFATRMGKTALARDQDARALWRSVYPDLTADRPGRAGAVLGRAEAQVARLSLLYALLDQCGQIRREHLVAALALWDYVERSVVYIFGESTGDDLADQVIEELRAAPAGLSRSDLRDRFQRNRSAAELGRALKVLARHGLARMVPVVPGRGPGRPPERWIAARSSRYAENAENVGMRAADENPAVGTEFSRTGKVSP